MKIQIRRNMFETNSSSVHSLIMCDWDEWEKWETGLTYFNFYTEKFEDAEIIEAKIKAEFEQYLTEEGIIFKGEDAETEKFAAFDDFELEWERDNETYNSSDFFEYASNGFETFVQYHNTKNGDQVVAFGFFGQDG